MLKERARCCFAMLPFDVLPRMLANQLMITVMFYLNAFAWKDGVSDIQPPVTIVEGVKLDFNKHFHVIFGECLHTHEDTANSLEPQTVEAIVLGPSSNLQGGIRCHSLVTGRILQRF